MTMPQQANQKVQDNVSANAQTTPPAGSDTLDAPKYTEKQWSEMRKKMQAQINDRATSERALQNRVDELESNETILKKKVTKLQQEIDDGIPEEAAEVVKAYHKRNDELSDWEVKQRREFKDFEKQVASTSEQRRQSLAEELSAKFGVAVEELLGEDDPIKMKAYAAEHFDPKKIQVAPTTPTTPPPEKKGEKPLAPVNAGGGTEKSQDQALKEMYPTMYPK